jgi:hypothetical protein
MDEYHNHQPDGFCRENRGTAMKTDNAARLEAMDALIAALGAVDAERFISMVKRDAQ